MRHKKANPKGRNHKHGIGYIRCVVPCALGMGAMLASARPTLFQGVMEGPADKVIHYSSSEGLRDPVALLQQKLDQGRVKLKSEAAHGYLQSLLAALGISSETQTLVFSKTSTQAAYTSPATPRALYYNDKVYVGWVPGGDAIDVVAVDPKQGPIFYTLSQTGTPKFERRTECLRCHNGPKTLGVPGLIVRSVYTASDGTPLGQITDFVSGHNSPLRERWGGWYVTGTHEGDTHLGNSFAPDRAHMASMDISAGQNVTSLRGRLDTSKYLSSGSDIVALLVLEHDIRMENWITRANYETRLALAQNGPGQGIDWHQQRIAKAGDGLLQYLLFRDEAPLKGKVKGTSRFADDFQKAGLRDSKGRSLRELDLTSRLFKYPCSYLIYSDAFNALPPEMKSYLWQRLAQILTGQDTTKQFSSMRAEDRKAVYEILLDTKPEFKAWIHAQAH